MSPPSHALSVLAMLGETPQTDAIFSDAAHSVAEQEFRAWMVVSCSPVSMRTGGGRCRGVRRSRRRRGRTGGGGTRRGAGGQRKKLGAVVVVEAGEGGRVFGVPGGGEGVGEGVVEGR